MEENEEMRSKIVAGQVGQQKNVNKMIDTQESERDAKTTTGYQCWEVVKISALIIKSTVGVKQRLRHVLCS